MNEEKKQIEWINGAKFVAILAVLVDHTYGILYNNPDIAKATYFSVALFVLLSGMTSYLSDMRYMKNGEGGGWAKRFICSCKKMLGAYCVATVFYLIIMTHEFNLIQYISCLIRFNASAPFYFVMVYIQLMLVNKLLFDFLQKSPDSIKGYFYEIIILISIMVLSYWTSNYTNILNIYGGGGKLLGGTYLIMYYLGMVIMKHNWLEKRKTVKSIVILIISGTIWAMLWKCICTYELLLDIYIPLSIDKNPPGLTYMLCAICMLFIIYGLFMLLQQVKFAKKILSVVCELGKHSMYIFLYHRLFLDYFLQRYMRDMPGENVWFARVAFLGVMIIGSILIETGIKQVQKILLQIVCRARQLAG